MKLNVNLCLLIARPTTTYTRDNEYLLASQDVQLTENGCKQYYKDTYE